MLKEAFRELPVATWLSVLPQILARMKATHHSVKQTVGLLLRKVADVYPEALIFPLIASTDPSIEEDAAANLLAVIAAQNPILVEESKMVSEQLIRVSILSTEEWHETLEQASRYYYTDKDAARAVRVLLKAFAGMRLRVESFAELSFVQAHARDLSIAYLYLKRFITANEEHRDLLSAEHADTAGLPPVPAAACQRQADLDQAWQIFYRVFTKLSKQISRMTHLDLEFVSSKLKSISGMHIAVPGRYMPLEAYPKIQAFESRVDVFSSKQRPRRITIIGSDGYLYPFLLKGHEDLRQDQRVMQVLTLINRLLLSETARTQRNLNSRPTDGDRDADKSSHHDNSLCFGDPSPRDEETTDHQLGISVYSVIPLSSNSGLIEWLSQCDTMHSLVRKYREAEDIKLSLELDLLKSLYPKYEELCLLQKIEAFEYTLDRTAGEDLREVLWRTSENSETWLQRRSNFTTSLGVMSMAGYVLGLGDRHPSNLMLRRVSARVVHIDFGDCFEVAMLREQFPEKIPFRLTRMMLNAMEVGGLEGQFRLTCERVLSLLRANRDAIVATLETFVYDPLVTWKLLVPQYKKLERLLEALACPEPPLRDPATVIPGSYHDICSRLSPHCASCHQRVVVGRHRFGTLGLIGLRRRSYTEGARTRRGNSEDAIWDTARPHRRSMSSSAGDAASLSVEEGMLAGSSMAPSPTREVPSDDNEEDNETASEVTSRWIMNTPGSDMSETMESMARSTRLLLPPRYRKLFARARRTGSDIQLQGDSFGARDAQRTKVPLPRKSRTMSARVTMPRSDTWRSASPTSTWKETGGASTTASSSSPLCEDPSVNPLLLSRQAEMVLERIETKLNGTVFGGDQLRVPDQVERLIEEATLKENLAQCFVGWCPFW